MTTVGLFVHEGRTDAIELGRSVARWLIEAGHLVVGPESELPLLAVADGPTILADQTDQALDLAISIGGDGTTLRATRRASQAAAPVLGINLGQLGYLAEIEPGHWETALERYFAGDHQITERMLVSSSLVVPGASESREFPPALNEVVVEKQAMGRTVRLGVAIDGEHFTSYVADGLILASPTGSTAYSLSARGPIMDPDHRALLLTPVSPHSLFDRSLILEPSSVVEVTIIGDRPAAVAVDGDYLGVLEPGHVVSVTAAPVAARFVTFGGRDFHRILKAKFGLNDR